MSDTPFADELKKIPKNKIRLEGSDSKNEGADLHGSIAHSKGDASFGVEGGLSQKKGRWVAGFIEWLWN